MATASQTGHRRKMVSQTWWCVGGGVFSRGNEAGHLATRPFSISIPPTTPRLLSEHDWHQTGPTRASSISPENIHYTIRFHQDVVQKKRDKDGRGGWIRKIKNKTRKRDGWWDRNTKNLAENKWSSCTWPPFRLDATTRIWNSIRCLCDFSSTGKKDDLLQAARGVKARSGGPLVSYVKNRFRSVLCVS
jgi:hypothetical protein